MLNLDLADILNQARRQALLTGKPLTDQETQGLTQGWKNASMGLANEQRQNQLSQDTLAQNRWETQAQIDAAKKTQTNQMFGNLINTGGSMVGMDWLKNKQAGTPNDSLLHEGWQGTKNMFNNATDKIGNPFGFGTPAPPPDYTGMGSLSMPSAPAGAPGAPGTGGVVPAMIPGAVPDAAPSLTPAIGDAGNFAGSLAFNPAATAAPDVASMTPLTEAPAAAGLGADAGISSTGYGAIAGLSDMADRALVRPMVNGFKGMGDWGKVGEDILNPLGAVHDLVGTWICTATAKHSMMTRAEEFTMSKLRTYAQKNHLGWWDSYFKNGTHLVKEIAGQETDLPKFYDNIRKILVEPVIKTFDKDPEKAFQIYLFVTQTLFKAYMPEFVFKEIK